MQTKQNNWYDSVKKDFSLAQKIVLFNEKNEILLIKANNNLWDIPGGHFEKDDENQIQSLKREVAEEIGESVDYEIFGEFSVELRKWQGEFTNVKVAYLAKFNLGKIKLSKEHSEFKWFSFEEIEKLNDTECKEWLKKVAEKAENKLKEVQSKIYSTEESENLEIKNITLKAVIVNEENKFLVLKRADNKKYNPNSYDLAGGKLKKNETFTEGLMREIYEETGIEKIRIDSILKISELPKEHEEFNNFKAFRFLARVFENSEIKLNKNEHQSYEWLAFDEALKRFSDENDFEKEKKEALEIAKIRLEEMESLAGWRRTLADFDNYKKRALEREREFNQYASEVIINEMLPVLDNFHSATEHIPEADQNSPWVMGIMYIQKQMEKVFEDNGVAEIEIKVGDEFNPETMEAMKDENGDDKDSIKKVVKISQKGYKIKDKIMRPAKVVVS